MKWYKIIVPDVIGSLFIILDLIFDIGFLVHLWTEGFKTIFWTSFGIFAFAWIFVNILAGVGILEVSEEMSTSDFKNLGLAWLWYRRTPLRILYVCLGIFGLLPYLLLIINCIVIFRGKRSEDDNTEKQLWTLMVSDNACPAVKEVQSILETGSFIYIKCVYLTFYASLTSDNWPLFLGLAFNVMSIIFGLRKEFFQSRRFPYLSLIAGVINCTFRGAILVILGRATSIVFFFLPIIISVFLVLTWGLYLYFSLPLCSDFVTEAVAKAKPKSLIENAMSSVMYTLFLMPEDWHTAISLPSYMAASIALAFMDIPIGLRVLMPLVGTVGLIPPKFWWWVFRDK